MSLHRAWEDHRLIADGGQQVAHTERGTPLPGQVRCLVGHLCSARWDYCPQCGRDLGTGGDEDDS